MFQFCLFLGTVLYESFYLSYLCCHLHHSQVAYLLCCLYCAIFQILSEFYDDGMETQSEEELFLQVIWNLLYCEAVLLGYTSSEDHWLYAVLYLLFVKGFHLLEVYFLGWVVLFVCT